ncbi:hypothetical protein [Paenibacillus tengchongensis]|uniref:hypothetical protein n=1 Tax=Paenibacillus tengchongensis TaxID=2608684 RepID=UPI00124E9449|nr:hypothetical protein [Paenibacillus tengchongensis]
MSMKPVELQIALPRTTDAGKVQNELQQRPVLAQQQISADNVRQSAEAARRSAEVDEPADARLQGREGRERQEPSSSAHKGRREEVVHEAEHPYKGHRIDLSL